MDTACREKMAIQNETSVAIIDGALVEANEAAKQCRIAYIDDLLLTKEILKGQMEDLLHETIHKIKNLKIEGILNESGMPTDQHADALQVEIEECLLEFETETNALLVDDPVVPTAGFIFDNIAKMTAFADSGEFGETESCLD